VIPTLWGVERGAGFDREAAERVLRRAVELSDRAQEDPGGFGISERALVEAADELGVASGSVLQAIGEERLGVLEPPRHRADRLVGPPTVTAIRVLDGRPDELLDALDAWLRHAGSLRRQRRAEGEANYRRRSDAVAGVQRTLRSLTGEEDLRRVDRLTVSARPVDADRSVVALVADLRVQRAVALAGGTGVAGLGSAASSLFALGGTEWLWLGVPASAAAGVGILAARAAGLPDVQVALDGVLDRLAAGDVPTRGLTDVRRRLVESTTSRVRDALEGKGRRATGTG
jgi:hypothetical protein